MEGEEKTRVRKWSLANNNQQQPAWLNSSSIKVCFPEGEHLYKLEIQGVWVSNGIIGHLIGDILKPCVYHTKQSILWHVHKAMSKKGSKRKPYLYIWNPWIPHKTILCLGGHKSNELKEVRKIKFLLYTWSSQIGQLMNQQYQLVGGMHMLSKPKSLWFKIHELARVGGPCNISCGFHMIINPMKAVNSMLSTISKCFLNGVIRWNKH